ncbi:MAG: glutamate--tRNA ligase [Candidatus Paceibacterota bacterium]|jgi:nondiscriminating glutamyl-tRNA synthetase
MPETAPIRVRIAPSPTGFLHLGTIRTALFNYLFAKKDGGVFVVRIEDTDTQRSLPVYEESILGGLRKLAITWDEGPDIGGPYGPYRQSERTDLYKKHLEQLLEEKKAYWCFCTKEELEEEKKAMLSQGLFPKYGGTCRRLTPEQVAEKREAGQSAVIRLMVPSGMTIEFDDMIRGTISVNSDTIGDIVIAKNESASLYNFAVVIDDELMKITHVIRGEDHISNTPKQILIQNALGFARPHYAHLPLILSPDRSKLSKRNLETSFDEYLKDGYLPQAIINFLGLLGWHPDDDQEIMGVEEMTQKFSLRRVQKAGAIFAMDKLDWFNEQYIKAMPLGTLVQALDSFIPQHWKENSERLAAAINIVRERMKKFSEFQTLAVLFFEREEYDGALLSWHDADADKTRALLEMAREKINAIPDDAFTQQNLEETTMLLADQTGRGDLLWPLRVAVSGQKNSPGPFEIMSVLGRSESLARIDRAIEKCSAGFTNR